MATNPATSQSVGEVVGENVRRLRERRRLTQHEAARLLLSHGLKWSRSKIAAIEAGERANLSLGDAVLLALAFDSPMAELFEGEGAITLADDVHISRSGLRGFLRDGFLSSEWLDLNDPEAKKEGMRQAQRTAYRIRAELKRVPTEADQTLASRLDLPLKTVTDAAVDLWERTLTEERDLRVSQLGDMEAGERQAHRGHITRELSRDIETLLRRGTTPNPDSNETPEADGRTDAP